METAKQVIDSIDKIKTKLTDEEYKEICDKLLLLSKESEKVSEDEYCLVFVWPSVYGSCSDTGRPGMHFGLKSNIRSVTTRIRKYENDDEKYKFLTGSNSAYDKGTPSIFFYEDLQKYLVTMPSIDYLFPDHSDDNGYKYDFLPYFYEQFDQQDFLNPDIDQIKMKTYSTDVEFRTPAEYEVIFCGKV